MTRYDPEGYDAYMDEDANGDWVRYSDIAPILEQHDEMLKVLKAMVHYQETNETEWLGIDNMRAYMRAKEVITKAEGRQA